MDMAVKARTVFKEQLKGTLAQKLHGADLPKIHKELDEVEKRVCEAMQEVDAEYTVRENEEAEK